MKQVRRFIIGIAMGLTMAVVMGGAVTPAHAAGTVVYVDDDPGNNGKVKCPATGNLTIEDGITAIGSARNNVTLYICPGSYYPAGSLMFSGFTKLRIIGKGGPIITAPVGFFGILFHALYSTKVTVQGLNISGGSHLSSTNASAAIYYEYSSGTIKGNTISRWHQDYSGAPPVAVGAVTYGIADYSPGLAVKVNITKNSIYDSQDVGIHVNELGAAKVTRNRIVFSSAITPYLQFGSTHIQAGILLVRTGSGTVVSGNQIESDADMYPGGGPSRGIVVYATSGAKVTKNTVRGTSYQITIENHCDSPSFPNANSNLISGNKLYDTLYDGIMISPDSTGGACGVPHTDFNKVTGNKIYSSILTSSIVWGVHISIIGSGVADSDVIKGNTFAGFPPQFTIVAPGATNLVSGPNKIVSAPPTGPLAAPAEPVTHEPPGPLPAYLLEGPR